MKLLGFLNSAVVHENKKQGFFRILGNPASSNEERANAYNGLIEIADHQDWHWLCSQFEQNLGELNSRVMNDFFTGAAQHCRDRLTRFVTAEDGVVATSVKAINSFTDFAAAAIFLTHRAISAMEALGMVEELKAFAQFVVLVCESKANYGLIPRKLFEERLRQYLPADVVDDQEQRQKKSQASRQGPTNGDRSRKGSEGPRPHTPPPSDKFARHVEPPKDQPIDEEGQRARQAAAGQPGEIANHALADAIGKAVNGNDSAKSAAGTPSAPATEPTTVN